MSELGLLAGNGLSSGIDFLGHKKDKYGNLCLSVSLDCRGTPHHSGGLALRDWERFTISVPNSFPFTPPDVFTPHSRFANCAHVQWKNHLCLFVSTSTEWNPSSGILGFLQRLREWLEAASTNQLDPIGGPLHPPVAYRRQDSSLAIFLKNAPTVSENAWVGFCEWQEVGSRIEFGDWTSRCPNPRAGNFAAVTLLPESIGFEYPSNFLSLFLDICEYTGYGPLIEALQASARAMPSSNKGFLVVGTASRGVVGGQRLQHLTAWELSSELIDLLKMASLSKTGKKEYLKIAKKAREKFNRSLADHRLGWCKVEDLRDEIVEKRDATSAGSWFKGKEITILGCGAIGSSIAEILTRSGVSKLRLVDYSRVKRGLLCRQGYLDKDIGLLKSVALRDRLITMRPDIEVDFKVTDICKAPAAELYSGTTDLIIDATANQSVLKRLELLWGRELSGIPLASFAVCSDAEIGLVTLSGKDHSGGPSDLSRRTKIGICKRELIKFPIERFWPSKENPGPKPFQPEPGCSEATFRGGFTEILSLSSAMISRVGWALEAEKTALGRAWLLPGISKERIFSEQSFTWSPSHCIPDKSSGYEVRIRPLAYGEALGWIRKANREHGSGKETGGQIFGEIDESSKVVWVDEVSSAPVDSLSGFSCFECGTEGTKGENQKRITRSKGSIGCIGMWHTHPNGSSKPSKVDLRGMQSVCLGDEFPPRKALLLILGGDLESPKAFARLFAPEDFVEGEEGHLANGGVLSMHPTVAKSRSTIGLALSGGGSRAIAFHLGVMRALEDRSILEKVRVISMVSGGSVIGAMYSYSNGSFKEFEKSELTPLSGHFI